MASKALSARGSSTERKCAEIITGAEALPKFVSFVQTLSFFGGMFPRPGAEEFGFVEKTGLFWIKEAGWHEHMFPLAKVLVVYNTEVSDRIVKGRMSAVKGLKLKHVENQDLFLTASASKVWIGGRKIFFRTCGGKHPTAANIRKTS